VFFIAIVTADVFLTVRDEFINEMIYRPEIIGPTGCTTVVRHKKSFRIWKKLCKYTYIALYGTLWTCEGDEFKFTLFHVNDRMISRFGYGLYLPDPS
jgi:hypothetical protein